MINIKNHNIFPYVVDKHNNVWKYIVSKQHFIKVTPWEYAEDRRINVFEIEKQILSGNLVQMKAKPRVYEIINKRWDDYEYSWEYEGTLYYASINHVDNKAYDAPIHKFEQSYKDKNGKKHTYYNEYRIGFYNGKLVWWTCYHYYPRAYVWTFESIDKEPKDKYDETSGHWTITGQWTNIKHIKPVYNNTTQKYI